MNYDGSAVGVPYVVVSKLTVFWVDSKGGLPQATLEQALRVKLADGTTRDLETLPQINAVLDFAVNGNTSVSIPHPETGVDTGQYTTLSSTFIQVLAIIRSIQKANGQ